MSPKRISLCSCHQHYRRNVRPRRQLVGHPNLPSIFIWGLNSPSELIVLFSLWVHQSKSCCAVRKQFLFFTSGARQVQSWLQGEEWHSSEIWRAWGWKTTCSKRDELRRMQSDSIERRGNKTPVKGTEGLLTQIILSSGQNYIHDFP